MIRKLLSLKSLFCALTLTGLTASAQNGLNFDGSYDYIGTSYDGSDIMGTSSRTIEAWINVPTTATANPHFITDYGVWAIGNRFTLNVNSNHQLRIEVSGWGFDGTTALNDGLWHHVAVTYDGTDFNLFVDGVNEGGAQQSSVTVETTLGSDLKIGSRITGTDNFHGSIDEVRVWNIARTQEEIQGTMNTEICEATSNLVAYYKLNEGTAGGDNADFYYVTDAVSGNNGILYNFALNGDTSNWVSGASITETVSIDATVSSDDTTLTANQPDATYQWVDVDNANAPIADETNQTFTPNVSGNYAVEITMGGCTETSETVNFTTGTLSLNDNVFANSIRLYPNPTSNYINVNLGDTYTTVNASLLSVSGRVVAQKTVSNANAFQMDLNHATGLYFLNISTDNGKSAILKVVKK
ncbi:LamG-like jellyroll fold domain-containing protein [Mangrovimonas aestuarii]|uniref:LamG-like jellyroll fold domain-containing protein n=1 Tax=Mangrovimonas aestuarii TaxID=3018443 RepID=UPI0023782C4A|nr:LamG-like jellyroll fold domain-containing protein [Mangrovimonas aestuarii]